MIVFTISSGVIVFIIFKQSCWPCDGL